MTCRSKPCDAVDSPNGSDGCDSTGAITWSSTAIASAKPPVKHIPTTPTPGPPQRACSAVESPRNQFTTGDDFPTASLVNSLLMHTLEMEPSRYIADDTFEPANGSRPSVPNRWGSTAVQPSSTTRSAKPTTIGDMPGSSVITITAGPVPLR